MAAPSCTCVEAVLPEEVARGALRQGGLHRGAASGSATRNLVPSRAACGRPIVTAPHASSTGSRRTRGASGGEIWGDTVSSCRCSGRCRAARRPHRRGASPRRRRVRGRGVACPLPRRGAARLSTMAHARAIPRQRRVAQPGRRACAVRDRHPKREAVCARIPADGRVRGSRASRLAALATYCEPGDRLTAPDGTVSAAGRRIGSTPDDTIRLEGPMPPRSTTWHSSTPARRQMVRSSSSRGPSFGQRSTELGEYYGLFGANASSPWRESARAASIAR